MLYGLLEGNDIRSTCDVDDQEEEIEKMKIMQKNVEDDCFLTDWHNYCNYHCDSSQNNSRSRPCLSLRSSYLRRRK